MVLRTGRKYHRYPTEHLGLPRDPETDFMLTTALEMYEQSLCAGGCGQVASESHDPAMEGRYERRTVHCQACAVSQGDGEKRAPGELSYVWRNPKPPRRRGRGAARPVKG